MRRREWSRPPLGRDSLSGRESDTQPRTISSAWTPLYKFSWAISIPTFVAFWPQLGPLVKEPIFLAALVLGGAYSMWMTVRLKRVRMDDRSLYIYDYVKEAVIPLTEVDYVTENGWAGGHPVTIHFIEGGTAPRAVTFMPTTRYFTFAWTSHPVVDEISDAADRARVAAAARPAV